MLKALTQSPREMCSGTDWFTVQPWANWFNIIEFCFGLLCCLGFVLFSRLSGYFLHLSSKIGTVSPLVFKVFSTKMRNAEVVDSLEILFLIAHCCSSLCVRKNNNTP